MQHNPEPRPAHLVSRHRPPASRRRDRPGEAQFMAVRIGQVEEALAPGGIHRSSVGFQARGDGLGVEGVHVGDVEDDPAPSPSLVIVRSGDQVQVAGARMQAGEGCPLTTVTDGEAQGAIEADCAGHVASHQADGTDSLDCWRNTHVLGHPDLLGFLAMTARGPGLVPELRRGLQRCRWRVRDRHRRRYAARWTVPREGPSG